METTRSSPASQILLLFDNRAPGFPALPFPTRPGTPRVGVPGLQLAKVGEVFRELPLDQIKGRLEVILLARADLEIPGSIPFASWSEYLEMQCWWLEPSIPSKLDGKIEIHSYLFHPDRIAWEDLDRGGFYEVSPELKLVEDGEAPVAPPLYALPERRNTQEAPPRVAEFMTPRLIQIPERAELREAADILVRHGISGAPVVDEAGKILGIFSETDLTRVQARLPEASDSALKERLSRPPGLAPGVRSTPPPRVPQDLEPLLVRDVYTPRVQSIEETATIHQAARAMLAGSVRRLLVTRNGAFVGVFSRSDLARAHQAPSGCPEAEIRRRLRSWVEAQPTQALTA